MKSAIDTAIEKIYENIAENGVVTDNQLALIMIYEKKNKPKKKDVFNEVLGYGKKIIDVINQNIGG